MTRKHSIGCGLCLITAAALLLGATTAQAAILWNGLTMNGMTFNAASANGMSWNARTLDEIEPSDGIRFVGVILPQAR